jgi:hypothetical protein
MTIDRAPFHVGVTAPDAEKAAVALSDLLGTSFGPTANVTTPFFLPNGSVATGLRSLRVSLAGPPKVELIEGFPGSVWDCETTTLHHVAHLTDDLAGDVEQMVEEGWSVELMSLNEGHKLATFAYLVKPGNTRIELVDKHREFQSFDTPGET